MEKKEWSIINIGDYKGWKKLFQMYYSFEISESFLSCMDKQLSVWLLNFLSLNSNQEDRLHWEATDPLDYEKGVVSKFSAKIFIRAYVFDIQILWRSVSGKIYEPNEEVIDCKDLMFEIMGLDLNIVKYHKFPINTLFYSIYFFIEWIKMKNNIDVSKPFLECADLQLTNLFIKATGIQPGKNCSMTLSCNGNPNYQKDVISKLPLRIYINHNWNPVTIIWHSLSGKIYDISGSDIDCEDIVFGFEGLDPLLYHKQLYPKEQLPFKFKDLGYELVVERLNGEAQVIISFSETTAEEIAGRLAKIDASIQKCIDNPIKIGKEYGGVAHNFKREAIDENKWSYDIDTGSAGAALYKKLLPFLSKLGGISKVEIL